MRLPAAAQPSGCFHVALLGSLERRACHPFLASGGRATSPEVARDEAVQLLTEMVKAKAAEGGNHLLVGVVENDASQAIYRVLLTLTCIRPG